MYRYLMDVCHAQLVGASQHQTHNIYLAKANRNSRILQVTLAVSSTPIPGCNSCTKHPRKTVYPSPTKPVSIFPAPLLSCYTCLIKGHALDAFPWWYMEHKLIQVEPVLGEANSLSDLHLLQKMIGDEKGVIRTASMMSWVRNLRG